MSKQECIKILLLIIIELIIFITLYFNLICPIKRQYSEFGSPKNIEFGNWNLNMMITNEQKEVFLKEIGVLNYDTNSIDIDKNINIYIGKDRKDKKTIGVSIIKANYNKIEDIEKQFQQFGVKISDGTYSRPIYIINQINYSVSINVNNENTCDIIFVTQLPYYYETQKINDESLESKVKYFIKENEKSRMVVLDKLKNTKIKTLQYIIIANWILVFLYYLLNKIIINNLLKNIFLK